MSGGSYDYIYFKIEELAQQFLEQDDPLRKQLGEHLKLVAKALHDIEWVDSGDYGIGDDVAAIKAVLSPSELTK